MLLEPPLCRIIGLLLSFGAVMAYIRKTRKATYYGLFSVQHNRLHVMNYVIHVHDVLARWWAEREEDFRLVTVSEKRWNMMMYSWTPVSRLTLCDISISIHLVWGSCKLSLRTKPCWQVPKFHILIPSTDFEACLTIKKKRGGIS